MALTGKQKRVLRGIGQLLEPIIHIGKEGVSQESIAATEDAFRRRELLKIRVLKNAPLITKEISLQLSQATKSEVAGGVGSTFLLYRENKALKERIKLPANMEKPVAMP